jgi:hypothetical protein
VCPRGERRSDARTFGREGAADEGAGSEVRAGVGGRQDVVGRVVDVRDDARGDDVDAAEGIARAEIAEPSAVGG